MHAARRWQAEADKRAKVLKQATSVAVGGGVFAAFMCMILTFALAGR